ncbi:hypothetical protein [Streptomyces sp. NPDC051561]|uniref:hypothetical protein n=1 Tax=Streptomyces sp. NPDC051561 TaxID=3365658 RepID=UPI00378DE78B
MGENGSISDEEWDRFLREAGTGSGDAPKEPSARARMVTRRLREEPAEPEGWRVHRPKRRRRLTGWYAVGLVAAVAVLVVALVGPGRVGGWFGVGTGNSGTPLAAETWQPGAAADPASGQRGTLDAPFRGSPAARWSDGVAGIYVPEAKATGWMSQAQVADALARSRDFLVASNLEAGVLRGERPGRAIAMISPDQPDMQRYLKSAFRPSPAERDDPLLMFSRFDGTKVRLVGDVVKTRGRLSLKEGKLGAVEVTADVSYVYPMVRTAAGSDEVVRTIVRRETVMSWDDPAKVKTRAGTFSLVSYQVDTTNAGCDNHDGYFSPPFGTESRSSEQNGTEVDPYDRNKPMDERMREGTGEGCGKATRS